MKAPTPLDRLSILNAPETPAASKIATFNSATKEVGWMDREEVYNPDRLIAASVTVAFNEDTGQWEATLAAGASAVVSLVTYTTSEDIDFPLYLTEEGYIRFDRMYWSASGEPQIIEGPESEGAAVPPPLPLSSVWITDILVTSEGVDEPEPPQLGDLYIPKAEQRIGLIQAVTSLSVITNFPINDRCNFTLREFGGFTITEVKGFQFGASFEKRPGQMFTFRNNQGVDVIFRNESADPVHKFYLTPEADFVLKPRETIVFRLDATMTKMEQVIAGAGGGDDGEYFPMTGNVYEDPVTGSVNTLADFNGTYLSINSDRYPRWTMTEGTQLFAQSANQGICNDGTYYYVSESFKITKRLISDNSIVATKTNPAGGHKIGGIWYDSADDCLYTVGGTYDAPYEAYFYKINKNTLDDISFVDITDSVDFGVNAVCKLDGVIYIGESGPTFGIKRWFAFDTSLNLIKPVFSSISNFQDCTVAGGRIYATDHQGGINVFEVNSGGDFVQLAYYFTGNLTALEGIDYKSGTTFRLWRILSGFTGFIEMNLTETLASKLPTRIIFHRGHALIGTSSYDQAKGIVQINGRASVAGAPEHSTDVVRKTELDALTPADIGAVSLDDYNQHFRGKYTSLSALETAVPTGEDGDYATVDTGSGSEVLMYLWDAEDGWVQGSSVAASTTDALPEGSSNLYFTAARVLATVITGVSFLTGGTIAATDTILVALGKLQKQINDVISSISAKLNSSALSGTSGYIQKSTGTSVLGNSRIYDNGTNIGIDTITPSTDWAFGNQSDRVIGIEESENTTVGRGLTVKAGRTINYVPNSNFNSLFQTQRNWSGIGVAPNGNVYAVISNGDIYMQTGGTGAFVGLGQTTRSWNGIGVAPNGNVYACVYNGDIYMQTGGTGDFVALGQTTRAWYGINAAPNGNVYAVVPGGDIYMQTGGTGNFVSLGQTSRNWTDVAGAPNGNVYACVTGGDIYMQTGGTGNFVSLGQTTRNWNGIGVAPNGNVYAVVEGGDIYMQNNDVTGTDDLDGGALNLKAGTGKGTGESRINFWTGTPEPSGTDMQTEELKGFIDGSGNFSLLYMQEFSDNTTALAGGLTAGMFYHTAGVLKIVI